MTVFSIFILNIHGRGLNALYVLQLGRYQNPEEIPFFADDLASPFVPAFNYTQVHVNFLT